MALETLMPGQGQPQVDPNSTQGVLQHLLGAYQSDEREALVAQRNQAQQQALQTMHQPMQDQGPINRMVNDYLMRYGQDPRMGWSAAAQAIGGEGQRTQDMGNQQLQRQQAADQEGAKMAAANLQESDMFGGKYMGMISKANGKPISPEMLRTVYTGARNEAAQISKNYNFSSAEEQSAWIEQQANMAVDNYVRNYAAGPSGPRGNQPQGNAPAPGTPAGPQVGAPPEGNAQIPAELPAQKPQVPAPVARDKAEEARKKEFSTETEKAAIKDYEDNVRTPARVADSMLQNINMIRQIPRTQDAFAPYREQLGSALNALGFDGKMVNEARSLQEVRPILAKIANDRLLLAKGVQTEGDAQRAYNEFVKITDTQQAADFMYAWAEELANRSKFKNTIYQESAKKNGSMREGSNMWDQTDYSRAAPVAILNGKPWTYTKWRDAFAKANPDASHTDLLDTWNNLATGKK